MSVQADDRGESPKGHGDTHGGSTSSAPIIKVGLASPKSIMSSDTEGAGARLSALSIEESPVANRNSMTQVKHDRSPLDMSPPFASQAPSFEVGNKPSGDVFLSPAKSYQDRRCHRSVTSPRADFGRVRVEDATDEQRPSRSPQRGLRAASSQINRGSNVGNVDAQGIYPPSACVFVANLPEPRDDRSLEAAVTREFSKWGPVFVKIRRDHHHMPFAFCQYTRDDHAQKAVLGGRGAMILGRPCRTEMVKANRTFIIHKRRGADITLEEAHKVLDPFGDMNKVEFLHTQAQTMLGLPKTIIVEFTTFDLSRDLHAAFRHHEDFSVDAFDLKKNKQTGRAETDEAFLEQYDIDRRSIFVGGLPPHVVDDDLLKHFGSIGPVIGVQLIKKTTTSMTPRVFAFVEFDRPDLPDSAVQRLHDTEFEGYRLRVERKVIKEHTPRRVRSQMLHRTPSQGFNAEPSTPEIAGISATQHPASQQTSPADALSPHNYHWTFGTPGYNAPNLMASATPPYGPPAPGPVPINSQQSSPHSVNPYAYYGGYWPGVPYGPDPLAHMGYYPPPYNSSNTIMGGRSTAEHPAMPSHTSGVVINEEPPASGENNIAEQMG